MISKSKLNRSLLVGGLSGLHVFSLGQAFKVSSETGLNAPYILSSCILFFSVLQLMYYYGAEDTSKRDNKPISQNEICLTKM